MTAAKATESAWLRQYLRDLDRRIARDKHQRRLAQIREDYADIRRREEQLIASMIEADWKWARSSARLGIAPIKTDVAERFFDYMIERDAIVLDPVSVARYRADANKWARLHKTEVIETATPGTNAYAFAKINRIEVAPIVNAATYAVRMHEQGHVVHPCAPGHKRTKTDSGEVCVTCELVAWQWAMDHAIEWTHEMHRRLDRSLGTYNKYAVGDQIEAVKRMRSRRGYCETRLVRASKGMTDDGTRDCQSDR
jgi:hypothetical protein